MSSHVCTAAIATALEHGNAILKFISPNDTGKTGSHQSGFYLPKAVWKLYTLNPPKKGLNSKSPVRISWHDGKITESCITWYGKGTRSEYRLTCFGRDFQWLKEDNVGNLLVIVPKSKSNFHAFVLESDDDIEELEAALGIEVFENWGVYQREPGEISDDCLVEIFNKFVSGLKLFPSTEIFSKTTLDAIAVCNKNFSHAQLDDQLLTLIDTEYKLFQMAENHLCKKQITGPFKLVDEFLEIAARITNRRKSRAGRSLENHVAYILTQAHIPFDPRPRVDGKIQPDILIPGKKQYTDPSYPSSKLCIIGVKRTCKDRWRQVLAEGKRIKQKHILTLQPSISVNQLQEMQDANVTLIVPERLQKNYPSSRMTILSIQTFVEQVRTLLA